MRTTNIENIINPTNSDSPCNILSNGGMCSTCFNAAKEDLTTAEFDWFLKNHEPAKLTLELFPELAKTCNQQHG